MQEPNQYHVPLAVLNTRTPDDELPYKDAIFPAPYDWLKANALRYYVTDEQILSSAIARPIPKTEPHYYLAGVYFLIKDGAIIYVGQSANLEYRLWQQEYKHYDAAAWIEVPQRFQLWVEDYYIDRIKPPLNIKTPMRSTFGDWVAEALAKTETV